jgi:cytochrome oxidase Cu insertion factor (SCO1/SenC/PrrC family)
MRLFFIGVVVFLLGPAIYIAQVGSGNLRMPWYLLLMTTLGVVFMLVSVLRNGGVVRIVFFVLFALLCAGEWFAIMGPLKTPPNTGPAQVAQKLPDFATTFADGKPFTNKDLETGKPTVLVFFRGRW